MTANNLYSFQKLFLPFLFPYPGRRSCVCFRTDKIQNNRIMRTKTPSASILIRGSRSLFLSKSLVIITYICRSVDIDTMACCKQALPGFLFLNDRDRIDVRSPTDKRRRQRRGKQHKTQLPHHSFIITSWLTKIASSEKECSGGDCADYCFVFTNPNLL